MVITEVRILQSHPQLDHLDLRYNRIGDKGAIHLAKIIKGHNIQLLDLQDNAICDSGAVSLYQACGRRLQLRLDCNSVPKHRLIELEEMLQARREEEERQMKEAQERLRAGKRKTNRPTSQQSKISQSLGPLGCKFWCQGRRRASPVVHNAAAAGLPWKLYPNEAEAGQSAE
eukprot:s3508_g3.t1